MLRQQLITLIKQVNRYKASFKIALKDNRWDSSAYKKYGDAVSQLVLEIRKNQTETLLIENPTLFDQFEAEEKAVLAAMNANLFFSMYHNNQLAQLDTRLLSWLICGYAIDVSSTHPYSSGLQEHKETSSIIRQKVCLAVINDSSLMKKINPATRILLLASVKKAGLYLSENSTPVARVSIDAAFNIRTDYNPEKNSWNKCLWPALAGGYGIGDYIGRCNEFISCALHETPQYTDFADDSRACAQVLVEDPALSERLSIHFENHNRYSKINPYNERFQLALKHRHVAILLLQHPALRGIPGEITEDHLQQLITHHKLSIPDSKIEKNAENQFEAQQETKLKTSMEAASEIPSAIQLEASPLKRPPEDHLQTQQISEKNEEAHQKPAPEVIPIIAMPSISQVEPASRSLSSSNTEATKPQLAETGIEHPTDKAQPTSNPLPCSSVTATIVRNSEGRYQATPPTDTYSNIDFSVEVDFTPSCTIL